MSTSPSFIAGEGRQSGFRAKECFVKYAYLYTSETLTERSEGVIRVGKSGEGKSLPVSIDKVESRDSIESRCD